MSIANKLSYLNETKKKLFTNINALGGDLTKDNTFREYALELDNMWENMPHTTGEGSIVILNTKKGKAKVNPFYADDVVQDGTPTPDSPIPIEVGTGRQTIITQGKNLIDTSSITSLTDKGITATFEDGYITLNGTVDDSSNAYFYIPVYGLRKGEIVSASANNESVNNNVYLIYYGENNIMSFTNLSNVNTVKANVTLVNNVESFGIQVKGPITLEDFVLRPQLERGSTVTAYELSKGNDICEINLGKNLWKNFNFTKIDGTITWNYYEDGRITVNGYTSKSNNYSIEKTDVDNNNWYINLEPGYYVLSGGKSSARRLEIVDSNGTTIASDIGNSIKFRLLEAKKVFVRAYVSNENEIDETFYPQIEKGSTSSSFSRYKEPIELCKIDSYQDTIKREAGVGKNLFNYNQYPESTTKYGVTITNNGDGSFTLNGTCNVDSNDTTIVLGETTVPKELAYNGGFVHTAYYISGSCTKASESSGRCVIRVNYNVLSSMIPLEQLNSTNNVISKIQAKRTSDVGWSWTIIMGYGDTFDNFTIKYQLEKGNTPTEYEPFTIKDRWYLHKEIGKVILDGTETWNYSSQTYPVFYTDGLEYLNASFMPYSNYYLGVSKSNNASAVASKGNFVISFLNSSSTYRIMLTDNRFTADNTGRTNFKNWLSINNLEVYYLLLTPTITEITDTELLEQLEKAYRLNTYDGITNISVDSANIPIILDITALSNQDTSQSNNSQPT